MTDKPKFHQQSVAITEALAQIERNGSMSEPELSWLRQAGTTLAAMSKMEELMRMAYRLGLEDPAVVAIAQTFPGLRFVDLWTQRCVEKAKQEASDVAAE